MLVGSPPSVEMMLTAAILCLAEGKARSIMRDNMCVYVRSDAHCAHQLSQKLILR